MNIEIEKITIIRRRYGTDLIFLYVKDQKQPIYPYDDKLVLETKATADTGEKWVRDNFPDVPLVLFVDES